ncbi:MAG TPA: SIMPL domain-containing protein [Casimicrobiaceae bacterium]|nr:SIMPL domain-containing protein [Casimicrobiaceae bacterium]
MSLLAVGAAAQPMQPPPFYNVITLEASATADVPADTLTATLFTEEQGPDPGQLAARVNARIEEALAKAKAEPKVEARSGNYQTTPVYDRSNQITGWRIRADVILESRDFKAIGALVGQMQPTLKLWSLNFSLSRRAREGVETTLTNEALARFQEKARAVAKTLGFPGHSLGQISIRTEGPVQPVPMFRTAAVGMAESIPPPPGPVPVEPGKGSVTVYVSGSVILGPPK